MLQTRPFRLLFIGCIALLFLCFLLPDWGFFGHRRINRLAVFTLPVDMMHFYKKHIEYVTAHAVDPDKRRYATKHEAVRHYIDLDHWGTAPYDNVPRQRTDMLVKFTNLYWLQPNGDTTLLVEAGRTENNDNTFKLCTDAKTYKFWYINNVLPLYYEEEWDVSVDAASDILCEPLTDGKLLAVDIFSEYGILPYHLVQMQARLTRAFVSKDANTIMRLSADFGHYIADAHVPLHTTENYNGQLTNQIGIHAFWESRLPELYADTDYDFFVGKAEYIEDPIAYYWDIVLTSHSYVDSVLAIEKRLSKTFPRDAQYCYEERLGRTIRTECRPYAEAYHKALDGQVEARMRAAVRSIGSAWFSAWVDAGQPDLRTLDKQAPDEKVLKEEETIEVAFRNGQIKGRQHSQ